MPTTSNFGWTTPADTDLVKDGAAAIRTLGNGVDASFIDLKGGTTGQVLSKATNTDLDYTWITPNVGDITEVQAGTGISVASGTGPIPVITNTVATAFDAAGDLVYGTGADTFTKLALGTAGQVLKVNSGATAPEWGVAAGGPGSWTLLNAGGTALTGATTITVSSIDKDDLFIWVDGASSANASSEIRFRVNADSAANYYGYGMNLSSQVWQDAITYIEFGDIGNDQSYKLNGVIMLYGAKSAVRTPFQWTSNYTGVPGQPITSNGFWNGSAQITSFSLISSTGNFDAGTLYVYGR